MSHVLHERQGLLSGGGARQIADEREPYTRRPFTAHAVAIQAGHFVAVVLGEVAGVEAQQPSIDALADRAFGHTVLSRTTRGPAPVPLLLPDAAASRAVSLPPARRTVRTP